MKLPSWVGEMALIGRCVPGDCRNCMVAEHLDHPTGPLRLLESAQQSGSCRKRDVSQRPSGVSVLMVLIRSTESFTADPRANT